jgi:hypothetical protein
MTKIKITSGDYTFIGRLEEEKAPKTCEWFLNKLPYSATFIQGEWSGAIFFTGLKGIGREVPFEKPTSFPSKGEILMYPGNDTGNGGEIYIPHGGNCFACPTGQLAGNHFLTIIEGIERLSEFGRKVRWEGAQEITFEKLEG